MALQTGVFALILSARGIDINHHAIRCLPAYHPLYFCTPPYHALHHVYPDAYFSSWIKTLDHLLGTGTCLAGRSVAMIGADTPFGAVFARRLEEEFRISLRRLDDDESDPWNRKLAGVDVLILCHADGDRRPGETRDSSVACIEAFCEIGRERQLPIEVWALAPEVKKIDAANDGTWARHARRYFVDPRLIYRHLELPRSVWARDADEATLDRAARRMLRAVRRGWNYVPDALGLPAWIRFLRFRALSPSQKPGQRRMLRA
jgi:hypothetical protein